MMNNLDNTDTSCVAAPFDVAYFPTLTSTAEFDVYAYAAQLSAIEELQGDIATTLYEIPTPSVDTIMGADRDVYSAAGDRRFNGLAAHNFLHTRYTSLNINDTFGETSPTITITGCDTDGYPYTYSITNTAYFLDQASNIITFPVYDYYGNQVYFPLVDEYGKFVLHQPVTAIDAKQQTIYFPLKDINNIEVIFPFKDATGTIVIVPPAKNSEKLLDVNRAYRDLDTAYENAKDADSFKFTQYILALEQTKKVGFFFGTAELSAQNNSYFAAAVYDISATDTDLTNIISTNLNYFIRYYPDRADLTYEIYQNNGGLGPFTIIGKTSSTNLKDIIENDRIRLASYNILTIPYWSLENTEAVYYTAEGLSTPVNNVHTSLLELYSNTLTHTAEISDLKTEVQTLCSTVNALSAKVDSLISQFTAVSANVTYNSAVIDTLVIPNNWQNIWATTLPPLFVTPITPTIRP